MLKKFVLGVVLLVAGVASAAAAFFYGARPLVAAPRDLKAPASAEAVKRGYYLAETSGCTDCHSKRDFTRYSGPIVEPIGVNGYCFDAGAGVPGTLCPPNLTSDRETGIGDWTDGEIVRAMREGIARDGRPLFPVMPYTEYRTLSDEDALAIVAYLRTLPAVKYQEPAPQIAFPVSMFVRLAPKPVDGPIASPPRTDSRAYGRYLAITKGCQFCHSTADDRMEPIPGRTFAGGNTFTGPWGVSRTANLTPHETGMGERTKENFIGLFRAGASIDVPVKPNERNTIMPWKVYSILTDEDLGALYDYIVSLPPVENVVDKFGGR